MRFITKSNLALLLGHPILKTSIYCTKGYTNAPQMLQNTYTACLVQLTDM